MAKIFRHKLTKVLIILLACASFFTIYNTTQAGVLFSVSDTMSRLKAATLSDHTIAFTTVTTIPVSGTIVVDFPTGFSMDAALDYTDIDLKLATVDIVLAAAPGSGAGTAWGAVRTDADTITLTNNDTNTFAAGAVEIQVGLNATFGVAGDKQTTNSGAGNNLLMTITTSAGDSGSLAVSIIADDQVGVGSTVGAPAPPGGGSPGTDSTPPIISNLRVVNILQTSATVLWDTNEPATSRVNYGLSASYGSSAVGDLSGFVTSHRVDLVGLTANTIYHFNVVTADASGYTTTTADDIFQTLSGLDITAPVISGVQVINITETRATVIWQTNEPAKSKVEYGLTDSYELGEVTAADFVTSHSLNFSGLLGNTTYHFRVTSADSSGNAATSTDDTFTTIAPADVTAPIISNIRVINITENSATVIWDTNEPANSRVKYGLTATYGLGNLFSADLVTTHSINLSSLTRSTIYHFEITSSDSSGNTSVSADQVFSTLPDTIPPGNVTDFLATPTAGRTIMLTWVNPTDTDFAGVLIKRSFTGYPASPADGELVFDGVATSFEDTAITPANYNRPIYYTAFAYDATGNFASGALAEATIEVALTLDVKAWPEKRWPRSGNWSTRGAVELREVATSNVLYEDTVATSDLGVGAVTFDTAPVVNYNISFKGLSHLRKILRDVPLSGGVNSLDFTLANTFYLLAGDVHRSSDNMVNALDISTLLGSLSTGNEVTDLNHDTGVNSLDINILLANLMVRGDE
ncbi:MAG: fibronectin type III domain-containing protein [Patescibacteria group bacterium]